MKKIGIITLYSNNNFGAASQAYALQYVLRKNGYECENIKYQRECKPIKISDRIKRLLSTVRTSIVHPVFVFHVCRKKLIFRNFINNNILQSSKKYKRKNVKDTIKNYNVFICGSDNIWNKNLLDTSFILDFVPDEIRKIAYAPGMSTDELSDAEERKMIPLIKRLDYLSCRELIGCHLIESLTERKVFHAMDPTLLISADEWCNISVNANVDIKGDYIFALIYGNTNEKCNFINKVGKKSKIDVVTIPFGTGFYNKYDHKIGTIKVNSAGPLEILYLIKNSKLVITDTFHATIFSILFHKNIIALRRFSKTRSEKLDYRIDGLFDKLGIDKSHIVDSISSIQDIEVLCNDDINYSQVDEKLSEWREASYSYLMNALKEFQ